MRYLARLATGGFVELEVDSPPEGLACALAALAEDNHGWLPGIGGTIVNPRYIEMVEPAPEVLPADHSELALQLLDEVDETGKARFADNLARELGELSLPRNGGPTWEVPYPREAGDDIGEYEPGA